MPDWVDADQIEEIVGVKRHNKNHRGRAVSAEQTVYILHSQECLDSGADLRDCMFSVVLDRGIRIKEWVEDVPVTLRIRDGRLVPLSKRPKP